MQANKEQFLLFRIRAFRDNKALEALVAIFGQNIQKFLYAKLPTREDAEDAFTETWMRFWSYAQSTTIRSVSAILYTIARGIVAEHYRKRSRQPIFMEENKNLECEVADPLSSAVINKIDAGLLKKEIEELDDEEAFVLTLRFMEGYRVKEIAKFLGKTENTTSALLRRVTNKLRERLKKKFSEL